MTQYVNSPSFPVTDSVGRMRRNMQQLLIFVAALLLTVSGGMVIGLTDKGLFVVVGLVGLFLALSITVRPQYGVYILVIFVFGNVSAILEDNFGIPDTNKLLVALMFVGIMANHVFRQNKPLVFRIYEMGVLLVGVSIVVSLLFSKSQGDVITELIDWGKDFLILLILVQLSYQEEVFKTAVWAIIWTAAVLAIMSLYQVATGNYAFDFFGFAQTPISDIAGDESGVRISGPLGDPNFYGMVMVSVLPSAYYRFVSETSLTKRVFVGIAALLILLTVLFTFSRGAFLALMVVGALIVLEQNFSPAKMIAGAGILLVIGILFIPADFWERISTIDDVFQTNSRFQTEDSLRGRSSEAIVAAEMFYQHPLTGVGYGKYIDNYLDYAAYLGLDRRGEERQAHSLYLEIAAEQGIIGLLAFGVMIFLIFRGLRYAKHMAEQVDKRDLIPYITGIQIGLIGYLIACIFLHQSYIRYLWLLVSLAAASIALIDELRASHDEIRDQK